MKTEENRETPNILNGIDPKIILAVAEVIAKIQIAQSDLCQERHEAIPNAVSFNQNGAGSLTDQNQSGHNLHTPLKNSYNSRKLRGVELRSSPENIMSEVVNEGDQFVYALNTRSQIAVKENPYIICWNCKDVGHTFIDCPHDLRHKFCFGCGRENVRKPYCFHCQRKLSENFRPSVYTREQRSGQPKSNTMGVL